MKRVVYSNITKAAAFIVCVAAVFAAVYPLSGFLEVYFGGTDIFTDVKAQLQRPVRDIQWALERYNEEKRAAEHDEAAEESVDPVKNLNYNLNSILNRYNEKIDYYIEFSDEKIKRFSTEDLESFKNAKYHYILNMKNDIMTIDETMDCGEPIIECDAKIYLSVRDSYVNEINADISKARLSFNVIVKQLVILFVIGILAFVYLLFVCGRRAGDKEIHLMLIDRMLVEFNLLIMAFVGIGGAVLTMYIIFEIVSDMGSTATSIAAVAGALTVAVVIALILSVVRNIKNRTFLERSLIRKIILWVWHRTKRIFGWLVRGLIRVKNEIKSLSAARSGLIGVTLLLAYTVLSMIFRPVGAIAGFALGCLFLGARARDMDSIRNGVTELKDGNLSYKIGECRSEDYNSLAHDINDIGKGMAASVEEKIKAERMKTELITNISHDLKTPLTSIINYTKLLEEMELEPEEAADYVKIIAGKSERLKNLTADLFDISKIRSGNEELKLERLDAALLISQTLGEHDKEINESGLDFIVKTDDELFIIADGRKMSRVMSNLIGNILKYAMNGTRVYISASRKDEKIVIELKNIASYSMDFDDEEITERFVRGDKSRTEEGNGLGLAIAKSYTEACGGSFRIRTDGDLFKAVIMFDAAEA